VGPYLLTDERPEDAIDSRSLPRRLQEQDVAAHIGVAKHRGFSIMEIDNGTIGNGNAVG
jgi:hypothetical protein